MFAIAGSSITSLRAVSAGTEQVAVEVATPSNSSNSGDPQATGVTTFVNDKATGKYKVSLHEAFTDSDGALTDLVFAASYTGDTGLLDPIVIDQVTGTLWVDIIAGEEGDVSLNVVATDANGNTAQTDIELDVDQLDLAAEFVTFVYTEDGNGNFVFSGSVVLNGNDSGDLTVNFGGDLDGHSTTVNSDGTFEYEVADSDLGNSGVVTAQVENGDGVTSDEFEIFWN